MAWTLRGPHHNSSACVVALVSATAIAAVASAGVAQAVAGNGGDANASAVNNAYITVMADADASAGSFAEAVAFANVGLAQNGFDNVRGGIGEARKVEIGAHDPSTHPVPCCRVFLFELRNGKYWSD